MGQHKVIFLSAKEENKYLYDRLSNAYAIRTKGFGRASFGGSVSTEAPVGPSASSNRHLKNSPLIGVALLVVLLVCFALFFGILHW